jgi:hypothetical protein
MGVGWNQFVVELREWQALKTAAAPPCVAIECAFSAQVVSARDLRQQSERE